MGRTKTARGKWSKWPVSSRAARTRAARTRTRKTRRTTMRSKPRLSEKKNKLESYGLMVACACARAHCCFYGTKVHCCFASLASRLGIFYRNQHTFVFLFFGLQAGDFLPQPDRTGRYDQRPA